MSDTNDIEADTSINVITLEADVQTSNEMDASTQRTDKEIQQAEFLSLLSTLRERSRLVRERLVETNYQLSCVQVVPPTQEIVGAIDTNAAQFMRWYASANQPPSSTYAFATAQTLPQRTNTNRVTATVAAAHTAPNTTPAMSERQQKKSRRALAKEVEVLQDLIKNLFIKNPEVRSYIRNEVQKSDVLRNMEIFRADGGREEPPTCSRYMPQATYQNIVEQHARTSSSSTKGDTDNDTSLNYNKNRKRSRRQKRKQKEMGTLKGELESLRKYINHIVQDYLGKDELEAEMQFTGDFSDLEAYAQRLVTAGLGRIVEEEIRVNRKNNRQSFITMSTDREGLERDGIVLLPVARRYAFEGDIVRAFVMNPGAAEHANNDDKSVQVKSQQSTMTGGKESFSLAEDEELSEGMESQESDVDQNDLEAETANPPTSDNCPKAFVITIIKQTELREIVGTIAFTNPVKLSDDQQYFKLKPHDMRVPMAYVPVESCAPHLENLSQTDVCGMLFLAHILETDPNGHCIAELQQQVGRVGNLESEVKAILFHNGLRDVVPYEQRFNDMFAEPDPPIVEDDLRWREDLRNECVFTIDPLTARDLDDAVSVSYIRDDLYEVGVHISDVAHYLAENSELDNIVKERATSIYLVSEVIHMLPQTLCFKCSLLPGEDKFAFSVFWQMNSKGQVQSAPRFTRSVIRSCTQFAYEHAQKIIDNPMEDFDIDDFPTICNGFKPKDIAYRVLVLHGMALEMRNRRFEQGALTINNPKLRFNVDPKTGEPLIFEVEKLREANHMIEEFMLLANQTVARFIYDSFPDIAILRSHEPPLSKSMKALSEKLKALGYKLEYSNSKAVQESMQRMFEQTIDPVAMDAALGQLLMKPMARAKYFCSENKEESDLWHYALSIPIYTHFTSPIRRYPDILVHRLLAAALKYGPPPARTCDELHQLAKNANERKYNAKVAGDDSCNLYFKRYVQSKQSIQMRAVVIEIFQHLMNVVTIGSGHVIGINYKMQKVLVETSNAPTSVLILERNSKREPIKLQVLSTVDIKLVVWDNKLVGFIVSPDPIQRQMNSKEKNTINKKKQHQHQHQQQMHIIEIPNTTNNNAMISGEASSTSGYNKQHQQLQQQQQQRYYTNDKTANNSKGGNKPTANQRPQQRVNQQQQSQQYYTNERQKTNRDAEAYIQQQRFQVRQQLQQHNQRPFTLRQNSL